MATRSSSQAIAADRRLTQPRKSRDTWLVEEKSKWIKSDKSRAPPPVDTQNSLQYLFIFFAALGIIMPKRHRFVYVLYSSVVNGLGTFLLPLGFTLSYVHMEGSDLEIGNLLTSVQVAIDVYGCCIKLVVMAFLMRQLRSADPVLAKLDARCTKPSEFEHLEQLARKCRRMVVIFAMAYWSYAISTFLASVVNGRPPYSLYNPFFDHRDSRSLFLVQSLMEFAMMFIACSQQVGDDSYAVIYVCILRTHVKLFMERVQRLGHDPRATVEENLEELKQCIIDHKNILELYDIIRPVISITIFIQFTITSLILCVILVNILLFATDFSSRVASCFLVLAVVTEIYPLCYYAQCLIEDCDRMSQVIFHSNWIDQDARYRKLLIFFMQRTQRRLELSAGKIFPITLNSFLSIAKFSFSLYTVIKEIEI